MFKPILAIALLLSAFVPLMAQEYTWQKKFVLVNDSLFHDEKIGIRKLVQAERMAYDIEAFGEKDLNRRSEEWKSIREDRKKKIVDPVLSEISLKIEQFEKIIDTRILLMGDLLDSGSLLAFRRELDFTSQFIAFANNGEEVGDTASGLNIAQLGIVSIDSRAFFAKRTGISKLANSKLDAHTACSSTSICTDVGKAIQEYIERYGYAIAVDQSKEPSQSLKLGLVKDVTKEFILYFNKR